MRAPGSDAVAEGVAPGWSAGPVAEAEPLLALGRRAVGPRFGRDPALELFLDPVVADSRGSIESIGNLGIRNRFQVAGGDGVRRPDTRVAVRLELHAH